MLLDANLLLYAVDSSSPFHDRSARWLETTLNGDAAVAFPWQTIGAFVRIATHPRVNERPMSGVEAWSHVDDWLATRVAWIPPASERTARVYATLNEQIPITGNLVPDAQLAALAIEHGLEILSADGDFARFPGVRWRNPVASA